MALVKRSSKKKGKAAEARPSVRNYSLVLGPVITEKASTLGGGSGAVVAFKVDPRASKSEIKTAIERVFKVEVDKVRTANFLGKVKRTARSVGRRARFKKAYITLKAGHTIDIVQGL